ncbi:hypothetical protein HDU93_008694 [Gonapodya sp. JEL0774]|nr:hypothetical protein HDU93_008694 [Gonapodya sp. JEL0774]
MPQTILTSQASALGAHKSWSHAAIAGALQQTHPQIQLQQQSVPALAPTLPPQQSQSARGAHRASAPAGTVASSSVQKPATSKATPSGSQTRFFPKGDIVEVILPLSNVGSSLVGKGHQKSTGSGKTSVSQTKRAVKGAGKAGATAKAGESKSRSKASGKQPRESTHGKSTRSTTVAALGSIKAVPSYQIIAEYSEDSDSDEEDSEGSEANHLARGMLLAGLRAAQEANAKQIGVRSPRRDGTSYAAPDALEGVGDSDWSSDEDMGAPSTKSVTVLADPPTPAAVDGEEMADAVAGGNDTAESEGKRPENFTPTVNEVTTPDIELFVDMEADLTPQDPHVIVAPRDDPRSVQIGRVTQDIESDDKDKLSTDDPVTDVKYAKIDPAITFEESELVMESIQPDSYLKVSEARTARPEEHSGPSTTEIRSATSSSSPAPNADSSSLSFAPKLRSTFSASPQTAIELEESDSDIDMPEDEEEGPTSVSVQRFPFSEGMRYGDYEEVEDDEEEEEEEIDLVGQDPSKTEEKNSGRSVLPLSVASHGAHWGGNSESRAYSTLEESYEFDEEEEDVEDAPEGCESGAGQETLGMVNPEQTPQVSIAESNDAVGLLVEVSDGYGVAYTRFPISSLHESANSVALFADWAVKSKEIWGTLAPPRSSDTVKPKRKNRWVGVARTRESTRTRSRQHTLEHHESDFLPSSTVAVGGRAGLFWKRRPALVNRKEPVGTGFWLPLVEPKGTKPGVATQESIGLRRKRRFDFRDEESGVSISGGVVPLGKRPKKLSGAPEAHGDDFRLSPLQEVDAWRKGGKSSDGRTSERETTGGKLALKAGLSLGRASRAEAPRPTMSPPPKRTKTGSRPKNQPNMVVDIDDGPPNRAFAVSTTNGPVIQGTKIHMVKPHIPTHPFTEQFSAFQPPLKLVDHGDDGNSLYRSLACKTIGSAQAHGAVRRQVVEFLKQQSRVAESLVESGGTPNAWWASLVERLLRDSEDHSLNALSKSGVKNHDNLVTSTLTTGPPRRSMTAARLFANYVGKMSKDGCDGDQTCVQVGVAKVLRCLPLLSQ